MLVAFSPNFVADTKIIFYYHFVAPLIVPSYPKQWWRKANINITKSMT